MELEQLYADIMRRGKREILLGKAEIDRVIDDSSDERMGLTLVIRPPADIQKNILYRIAELKAVEPEQYFYPASDFHITLFDIMQARQGFRYTAEQKNKCIALAEAVSRKAAAFCIQMKGLVLSEGCIMVKGFCDDEMQRIRGQIRENLVKYGLSPDERYPAASAHITIVRFRKPLIAGAELVRKIEQHSQDGFGSFPVSSFDLVYHNWYDSRKETIQSFQLRT